MADNNIKFNYLYRDAGNYKQWAGVVFSNPEGLTPDRIGASLADAFLKDGLFIASQIRVPEVFFHARGNATSDDHCFHEFDRVEVTFELPNDRYSRSIEEFVAQVKHEAKRGWIAFDPHENVTRLLPA